jgi:hypothetical protein
VARLRIALPAGTEGPLRLYLGCRTPGAGAPVRIRAHVEGEAPPRFASIAADGPAPAACVLDVVATGADLIVEIDSGEGFFLPDVLLEMSEPADPEEPDEAPPPVPGRMVGLGVTGVMACRPEDTAARLEFLESQAFRILRPE